jgi:hypothetical protein
MNGSFLLLPLLLVSSLALAESPTNSPTLTGTWQWHLTMPDGTEVHPKLRLKQDGTQLTGTSSIRLGTETAITNGTVQGSELRFDVVRQHNGITVITRYSGRREDKVIRGQVESNWSGEPKTYPWEAHQLSGIEGTWKWYTFFGERRFESKATLKLDGDKLTGTMPGRDGRTTAITNGTFSSGEVFFELERGRDDFRFHSKFQGKLEGDSITGTIETTFGSGEPRTADWNATRAD